MPKRRPPGSERTTGLPDHRILDHLEAIPQRQRIRRGLAQHEQEALNRAISNRKKDPGSAVRARNLIASYWETWGEGHWY